MILLSHAINFDSGQVVQEAEFQADPVLFINLESSRLTIDEMTNTLGGTLYHQEEFQIQFEAS